MAISSFRGRYEFLSNFYRAPILIWGLWWETNEHAFQAAKTTTLEWSEKIRLAPTPDGAKSYGRQCPLRDDWDEERDDVMLEVVRAKFAQHNDLRTRLLETGDAELIEGNHWGDTYWGQVQGHGQNKLGKILMRVREETRP